MDNLASPSPVAAAAAAAAPASAGAPAPQERKVNCQMGGRPFGSCAAGLGTEPCAFDQLDDIEQMAPFAAGLHMAR